MKVYYYATFGDNGVGVFTDYDSSYRIRNVLYRYRCKKFKTFYEARECAMEEYNERQHPMDEAAHLKDSALIPCNSILYRRDIMRMNGGVSYE